MHISVSVLVENTALKKGLLAEHGLSVYIEAGEQKILFDTGQSGIVLHNAKVLGHRLDRLDAVVLSHGHYDHTGGLKHVLKSCGDLKIYAHPSAFKPKFACNENGVGRSIGLPGADGGLLPNIEKLSVSTTQPTEIIEGIFVTGQIPRVTPFEDTGGPFFLDAACTQPDLMFDDQALFFNTSQGTVVLLGCAHAGVINTLVYVHELTGGKSIHAVMGGMHLLSADEERMNRTMDHFYRLDPDLLGPAHCTGRSAVFRLHASFGRKCIPFSGGTRITFTR
ncbi:MAG: MBL fold metallo-hydrolase [Deltaproteobacteria bacterium]|nr:MBL fold metallo-hydrolase [Deltaproteobacteria bacterium]MBW1923152.1 MBL fold metallo-hydrolase [Deltaproteobacteria bacterium]MBW1949273.1 MBL fold metallo-hydrolase [Deltaproteobacteria bacterium]MBW2008053.1 MBL fold metallo-hydrolase [Deltaproteobacteria bacterium]MBW2347249.1 MBL fold metallo-hydrolase [Deltaproteobacteria bacterium]